MARKKKIADMDEVNQFWSGLLRDEAEDIKVRLKASELRARAAGGMGGGSREAKTDPAPVIPLSRREELLREIAERFGSDQEAPEA